jgi:biotin transporter BioY
MKFYFLDAGGAGLVFGFMIIFMIAAIIVEALIMLALKYNPVGKAFLDSLVINLVSLGVGFMILSVSDSLDITDNEILNYILVFLITVLTEMLALYLLNRSKPFSKTMQVSFVINLVSYGILFLFTIL